MKKNSLCFIGTAEINHHITSGPEFHLRAGSLTVHIGTSLGGDVTNMARAAQPLGCPVQTVFLVGSDSQRMHVESMAGEFSKPLFVPLLARTRQSVIVGDSCLSDRPLLKNFRLPEEAIAALQQADRIVIAPMTAHDHALVTRALRANSNCVLQLSESQVKQPRTSFRMAHLAEWTIVTRHKLSLWTGCHSLEAGLLILRDMGIRRLLVTSPEGVNAMVAGKTKFFPAHPRNDPKATGYAEDVFVGTFAALITQDITWRQAIPLAQTAGGLFVEGLSPASLAAELPDVAETPAEPELADLPELPFQQPKRGWKRPVSARLASCSIAATVLVSSLLSWGFVG